MTARALAVTLALSAASVACSRPVDDEAMGTDDASSSIAETQAASDAAHADRLDAAVLDTDPDADDDGDAPYDEPVPTLPAPPANVAGSPALLSEAESILATLTSTHYQHASHVDAGKGIYDVDCSGFVNYVMAVAVSDAYDDFKKATVSRPVADSYVKFIGGLAKPVGRWHRVILVSALVPGDILTWTIPKGVKSSDTGHVMIVEKAPVLNGNQATVVVLDSTDNGHGDADPRVPKGPNGIGRGTAVVMMNKDGTASGYRWSLDSDSPPYVTNVEMAHLD